jgi:hypothetical protein
MKYIFTLLILLCCYNIEAQHLSGKLLKNHPVKSVQWGSVSVMFIDGFWDMASPQLRKKFTRKIADSLEAYSMSMYQPGSFDQKRDSAKMYMVATFDNNFGGTFHGVEYVVMVPYAENKKLWQGEKTRPTDFFLIFPKNAVELEK